LGEIVSRHKAALLLLLALQLVRGVFYSAVVPPWQAPDEPWHYDYIRAVSQGEAVREPDAMPVLSAEMESSLRTFNFWRFQGSDTPPAGPASSLSKLATWLSQHKGYPPLHPMLLAPLYALVSPLDVTSRLLILRLSSVLLGVGVIFLAFLVAAFLFPEEEALIIGIPGFILFLPMHTFMTSVVNNDGLAEFWASLALFLMLTWFRDRLSLWRASGAALVVALGVLTKRTAVFLIPLFLFAAALYAARRVPREKRGRAVLLAALALPVSLAALGLFVFYVGPLLQGELLASFVPWGRSSRDLFAVLLGGNFSYEDFVGGIQRTFFTFWADFGWANVPLTRSWYIVLTAICLAVAVGLALYLFRFYRQAGSVERWRTETTVILLVALFLPLLIGLATEVLLGGKINLQARYLFPAIIPIATFFLLGWRELFPPKYRRFAVPACLAGLALFDAVAMSYYIIPFYYS
jgi:4-amino-4-deoxy-L-arabinose transferase-like glycosyltransferase